MPLVPDRPPQPSLEDAIERDARAELGKKVTAYYENLDISDPENWPTDDETKTIPPIHTMMKNIIEDE